MLRRISEPLAFSEASLLVLRPALNAPVLNVEFLPVGPARAAVVAFAEEYGGMGLALGIRSVESGQVVLFRNREPIDETASLQEELDPVLATAERMGFLFDEDMLIATPGGDGRAQALALWGRLMGEVETPVAKAAPALPAATEPVRAVAAAPKPEEAEPVLELDEPGGGRDRTRAAIAPAGRRAEADRREGTCQPGAGPVRAGARGARCGSPPGAEEGAACHQGRGGRDVRRDDALQVSRCRGARFIRCGSGRADSCTGARADRARASGPGRIRPNSVPRQAALAILTRPPRRARGLEDPMKRIQHSLLRSITRLGGMWVGVLLLSLAGCATTTVSLDETPSVSPARAKRDLGVDYLSSGRTAMAIRELKASLDLDSRDAQTHLWLGEAYRRKGQVKVAEKFLLDAVRRAERNDDSTTLHEARLNLSALLSQMGRYEDSLEHCEALAEDPTLSTPWRPLTNCGWALMRLSRLDEARTHFEEALDFFPRYGPALLNLGILEAKEGHRLAAIQRLQAALEARMNASAHSEANYRLGELFVALGQRKRAVAHFQAAAESTPNLDWGSQSQAYLDLLR